MKPLYSQVHQLMVPSTRRGLSSELLGSVEFNGFMSVVNPLISEIGRFGSTEKRAIGGKKSLRCRAPLGDPRWCAKWLGAIRGR